MIESHIKEVWNGHAPASHELHSPERVLGVQHAHVDALGNKTPHDSFYRVRCSCGEVVKLPFEEK